ncbi:ATP-binding protein [Actinokineospora sp.]|uniref:ATP-binding protein n=1 Tax=Actinokineospora sp. TaxID=1872133 RepID=UPI004037CE94
MAGFVGRKRELRLLSEELAAVRAVGTGRCLLLRGRRRVGKSRLVEEFIERAAVPAVFYSAAGVPVERELAQFSGAVLESDLPGREQFTDVGLRSWDAALRLLTDALPDTGPSVVVLDKVPYLVANDSGFEGTLQRAWDRVLSRKPVLLILVGSDLSMMEALNTYGRPFHQRGVPLVLDPLDPAEVGEMLDLGPATAFDAHLVTGGLPLVCAEWPRGGTVREFLAHALGRQTSALAVSAELALAAEFPTETQARQVLTAIGAGERTRASIGRAVELPHASLDRALKLLIEKRVVAAERPLSTVPSKETRYRVADSYLRFWLNFLAPHRDELDRGRGDRVLDRIDAGWTSWRGRAIEPVIREALLRILPGADPVSVGGYWTRTNEVEVDLVGADRSPVAREIRFVGSIKWLERRAFDHHDLAELIVHRDRVPGTDRDTPLIVVSRAGSKVGDAVRAYGPADLIAAWH